jgi:hypothetical protein
MLRISGCLRTVAVSFAGVGLGVMGTEGVGDAPAVGVGLTFNAAGVDLRQNRQALPGEAGDLDRPCVVFDRPDRVPNPAEAQQLDALGNGVLSSRDATVTGVLPVKVER